MGNMNQPAIQPSAMTEQDLDLMEQWWIEKSRKNFYAYRQYMRHDNFKHGWFISQLCSVFQSFYWSFKRGERPIYVISTPPQHGKSIGVADFISWMLGLNSALRIIYGSFSDLLGKRCNFHQQRFIDSDKYKKIFPETALPIVRGKAIRNSEQLEIIDSKGVATGGGFRNTTVNGKVNGESLDIGVIDDPLKGREQANSPVYREKIWDWFTDDFNSRFDEFAGLLIIMTRWDVDDLIGRLIDKKKENKDNDVKVFNWPAISIADTKNRSEGEALFPELKSETFLLKRKGLMRPPYWGSLYQGSPVITGGNLFKDKDWQWWKRLPPIAFKFIVADTAQKIKTVNDWTCFQCWGYGENKNIYLLDMFYAKLESPDLRKQAILFYNKHNTPRINIGDPILRGFYIEDKSSGSGLIQELERKKLKVYAVPRNTDKVFRANDAIPEIEAGRVYLNTDIHHVDVITTEARQFPNGKNDDAIDTTISAIEVAFIDEIMHNSLQAAMEAED